MGNTDAKAEEIADDLLYRTGQALLTGDYSCLEDCFALPQILETLTGKRLVETREDIFDVFDQVRRYYRNNDVTDIVRTVVHSEFIKADLIGSTHVSRLIQSDGTFFRAPFPAYSVLKLFGDKWMIASTAYAILDAPDHNAALSRASQPNAR